MIQTSSDTISALSEALTAAGWLGCDEPLQYRLRTRRGAAMLHGYYRNSGWFQFHLMGDAVPATSPTRAFGENWQVHGPAKFVSGPSGMTCLRADLPVEILSTPEEVSFRTGSGPGAASPVGSWADDITALATASAEMPGATPDRPETIAAALTEQGWIAAVENEQVRLTMAFPGLFRHVTIRAWEQAGTRIWTELVDLAGWPETSRRAAEELARQAGQRLQLVRFAMPGDSPRQPLVAEVFLRSARVPGAWLDIALETVRAAVALCARELLALGDPRLAERVLDGMGSE